MNKKFIKNLTTSLLLGFMLTGCGGGNVTSSQNSSSEEPTTSMEVSSEKESEEVSELPPASEIPTVSSDSPVSSEEVISNEELPSEEVSSEFELPEGAVTLGFVEEPNLPADTFGYWNDQWWVGSSVTVHQAYFYNNEATFDYEYMVNSATDWGFQVFYDNTSLEVGKTYILTMNIYSEDAVKAVINGTTYHLVAGDNSISVTYVEPETGKGSISIQFDKSADMRNKVVISNMNWELTLSQLPAPEGVVVSEPAEGGHVIAFAAVNGASGYTVVYVDTETGQEVAREDITRPGDKMTASLEDGTYKVMVIAKGDGTTSSDSVLSSSFAYLVVGEIEQVDPNTRVEIGFGEEANLPLSEYVYWNDQWWVGSYVTVHEAYMYQNEIIFDYEYAAESSTDWGFQVFYKNATLSQGKIYTLTMNIHSEDAVNIKVNQQAFSLVAGDNEISVEYTEGGAASASLAIQFDKSEDLRNLVKLTNVTWTSKDGTNTGGDSGNIGGDVTNTNQLSSIEGGVINAVPEGYIFACAPVENATGYHLQVLDSSNNVVAEQDITNGGQITCTSKLPSGTYSVQVKAVSDGTYEDSNYVVVSTNFVIENEGGNTGGDSGEVPGDDNNENEVISTLKAVDTTTNLVFGEEGKLPADTAVYWNDQWWCGSYVTVHSAYQTGKDITIDYEYAAESSTDWGLQVFYDNTELTVGETYVVTMNIHSEDASKVKVNGSFFDLVAGDNEITVEYNETATTYGSLSMQFDKSEDLRNTIKISNVTWTSPSTDNNSGSSGGEVVDGTPINLDLTKTKMVGAGIHVYFADKPAVNVGDINVTIVSFDSEEYATYESNVMNGGVKKIHYIQDTGFFLFEIANGFPDGSDVEIVVNISYTLNEVTYSSTLTFVGNVLQ